MVRSAPEAMITRSFRAQRDERSTALSSPHHVSTTRRWWARLGGTCAIDSSGFVKISLVGAG